MSAKKHIDKIFLGIVFALTGLGIFAFLSASLGVLAKSKEKFIAILVSQLVLGLILGLAAFWITLKVPYKFWRRYSLFIFLGTLILAALVFIPGLGFKHAGATRWISIGSFSFQPVELLKLGFIIYFAAWLSAAKEKVQDFKWGILPFLVLLGLVALILFKQPDVKSFILIVVASLGMFMVSGVRLKSILALGALAIVILTTLVFLKPYLLGRVLTFIDPARDPMGSSYQLQQSLIALGSGGIFGRGYGQSVQKFSYLPEPQGDSIFAVFGEEFGFIGTSFLIFLFVAFILRGLRIAHFAPDPFSRLLTAGIVILIGAQAFLNIAAITGLFPLTGVPLPFVSQGGTALMIALAASGMVLNISKQKKTNI